MPIKRTPGWFKEHYYDQFGKSWCGRWGSHGVLKTRHDPKYDQCENCADKFFRWKYAWKEFKSQARLKWNRFKEKWSWLWPW